MNTAVDEVEAAAAVPLAEKNMQVSIDCPISAYQTIVARTKGNPEYIVTLHELFGTFVKCVNHLSDTTKH